LSELQEHASSCGFNKTVLQHITVVKHINGSPYVILDAGLVADVKLRFLASTLTSLDPLSFSLGGYLKTKVYIGTVETTGRFFYPLDEFTALRFTVAGAPLAARCMRILAMNHPITFAITCRPLHGIIFHSELRFMSGSLFMICQQ
jgi:hypothetical protein